MEMRKKRPEGIIELIADDSNVPVDGEKQPKIKGLAVNLPAKKKSSILMMATAPPIRKTILLAEKNKALEKSLFTVEKHERKVSLMLGEKYRQSRPSQIMRNYGKEVQGNLPGNQRKSTMRAGSPQRSSSAHRLPSRGAGRPSALDAHSSQVTNESSQTTSSPSSPNQRQRYQSPSKFLMNNNNKPRLTINTRASTISPFAKNTPSSAPNSAGQGNNSYLNALHPSPSPDKDGEDNLESTLLSKKSRVSMRLFGKDTTTRNNQKEDEQEQQVPAVIVPSSSSRPNSRKTKVILKREDLTKELIQSRKVSRLPMPMTTATTTTNNEENNNNFPPSDSSLPPVKLTKRRQPSRGENKIL
jgi:hypothetical protein